MKSMIINTEEYLDAMNANWCAGVEHACDELQVLLDNKKTTKKDIEKWCKNMKQNVIKTRKLLTVEKKVIKKVSVLK